MSLISKYKLLSARRDHEMLQDCQTDLACVNRRLAEVASPNVLSQIAARDPAVAASLVTSVQPSQMTWHELNFNIQRYRFYENMCGSDDVCMANPRAFIDARRVEVSLGELAARFALSFYKNKDGDVVVVDTAITSINAALGLVELSVPEAASVMAKKQFALSATGEVIKLFQKDDPARQAVVSAGALAGGLAASRVATTVCGGVTVIAVGCAAAAGALASGWSGDVAGLAYDFGLEGF